ncbi:hypothetical protein BJX65DRAFT_291232 [Aspergillus insuetus]
MDKQRYREWLEYRGALKRCRWFVDILTCDGMYEVMTQTLSHLTASEIGLMLDTLGLRDKSCVPQRFMNPLRDLDPTMRVVEDVISNAIRVLAIGEVEKLTRRITASAEYWAGDGATEPPRVWFIVIPEDAPAHGAYLNELRMEGYDLGPIGRDWFDGKVDDCARGLMKQLTVDPSGPFVDRDVYYRYPHGKRSARDCFAEEPFARWVASANAIVTPYVGYDVDNDDMPVEGMDIVGSPVEGWLMRELRGYVRRNCSLSYIDITADPLKRLIAHPTIYQTVDEYGASRVSPTPVLELRCNGRSSGLYCVWRIDDASASL